MRRNVEASLFLAGIRAACIALHVHFIVYIEMGIFWFNRKGLPSNDLALGCTNMSLQAECLGLEKPLCVIKTHTKKAEEF